MDHERFMDVALEQSRLAHEEGNVPVGSLIVKDGEVVGIGRNRVNTNCDPTAHAEVEAIRDACRKLGTTDLAGATCYTAMEPCPMCCWAIQEAGIARLVLGARHASLKRVDYGAYAVESLLRLTDRQMEVVTGVRERECEDLRRRLGGFRAAD
jgi:tRNA(adenine34) deaminase